MVLCRSLSDIRCCCPFHNYLYWNLLIILLLLLPPVQSFTSVPFSLTKDHSGPFLFAAQFYRWNKPSTTIQNAAPSPSHATTASRSETNAVSTASADNKADSSISSKWLTSALLQISYDGGRFTGWSSANDPKPPKQQQKEKRSQQPWNQQYISIDSGSSTEDENLWLFPPRKGSSRGRRWRATARRQSNGPGFVRSIQGVLQQKLAKVFGNVEEDRIVVEGCSRTDKGVHAVAMMAQIYCLKQHWNDTNKTKLAPAAGSIPGRRIPHPIRPKDDSYFEKFPFRSSLPKLAYTLNRMLPDDVRVVGIAPTPRVNVTASGAGLPFHPSLSVTSKTYQYTFSNGPFHDPTPRRRWIWHIGNHEPFDLAKMQRAASVLQGRHDFRAFAGAPRGASDQRKRLHQSSVCTMYRCSVEQVTGTDPSGLALSMSTSPSRLYRVVFTGDRFLYKMVRFMVGALVGVATEDNLTVNDVQAALETGLRPPTSVACAPAHGLVLQQVDYGNVTIEWQPVVERDG